MNPTVLYFHHVGPGVDHYTSVTDDTFQRMLDHLQGIGEFVDLAVALQAPQTRHTADSSHRFVLTFDDGYDAVFGSLLDKLMEREIPATFFVVPAWAGARAPHAWAPQDLMCADADTLRGAQSLGFRIGSHTWSHERLDLCSPTRVAEQLERASEWLREESLGMGMEDVVAYPCGYAPSTQVANVLFGFGTGRRPTACWWCRSHEVSRVYLAAQDERRWEERIDGWFQQAKRARDQCRYPDHR